MKRLVFLPLLLAVSGCADVETDAEETTTAFVEFDPANRIVPFPNNLLINPATGKVSLPAQCNESPTAAALREGVLNKLDGFGTYQTALTATFTEVIDMASVPDKIVIFKRGGDVATAASLPFVTQVVTTQRFDASCRSKEVSQLIIVPTVPLEQKSVYVVALLKGIKATSGKEFSPSPTWAILRSKEDPVTVVDGEIVADLTPLNPAVPADRPFLLGIDQLWDVYAGMVKFLAEDLPEGKRFPRPQILLAWEFKTQTTTDPLDPAVAGSPAASVRKAGLLNIDTIVPAGQTVPQFIDSRTQAGTCSLFPCAAVDDVKAGTLRANRYQPRLPNPLPGTCQPPEFAGCPIAGQWSDPVNPALQAEPDDLQVFIVTPKNLPCPATGCPTIIFNHRVGGSKANALAIGARFAEQGFATVAIDTVAHGDRRARISNTGICVNTANPQDPRPLSPTCYAPFLSPNFGATRDNIRQTVVDYHSLVAALKVCNGAPCNGFKPDLTKLFYVGQSLGGHLGGTIAATIPDLKASVLNVAGVGWLDMLEGTQSLGIKCPLVDGLIAAGVLVGETSNFPMVPTTGLCTGDEWRTQPAYRQLSSIGRWVLDPADPANFTQKLAARRFLLQQVDGDDVVPNLASDREAALTGIAQATSDAARNDTVTALPPASPAIDAMPMTSKRIIYKRINQGADPANTFGHASLSVPTPPPPQTPNPTPAQLSGLRGTLQMQSDAINFLKKFGTP